MSDYTVSNLTEELKKYLRQNYGRDVSEAGPAHIWGAAAMLVRDQMTQRQERYKEETRPQKRELHYLSMEFLIGRSLAKNAFNLGLLEPLRQAVAELGFDPDTVFEEEPDAALGNGGLGRLAACYLDSMTTLEIPATGYSICYELGVFRQKIIDGAQVELPDSWLDKGQSWLFTQPDEEVEIKFDGTVETYWDGCGRMRVHYKDYVPVIAVPRDMLIAGYNTDKVNTLRLWDARSPDSLDMSLFSRGEYLKAVEQRAMAEVITKVLYPDDNHPEGKSLRLKQQYFFVSATVQSVLRRHRAKELTVRNFAKHHVFQINDTHPTLVIPELMRVLLDEDGLDWDEAWDIVTHCVAYTNHTVLAEALEHWHQSLIQRLLPRIWTIIQEIAHRWEAKLREFFHGDMSKVAGLAIIWDGEVYMTNLCLCACYAVNGVSALHTNILKTQLFKDAYAMMPDKFLNVTNGIDHRRWMAQANPGLHHLICDLLGSDQYLVRSKDLAGLEQYTEDKAALERLAQVKRENKVRFAQYIQRVAGIALDPDSVFDVQVKRLHEYKRQLLNVMNICLLYNKLHDDPNMDFQPVTFLFGAKAAAGYHMAKEIIRLICSIAKEINNDPVCKGKLSVHFLENYCVSLAEQLMPAAEVSQQISTAGKEASGTGNMKFMANGAITIGTLDGANVEMHDILGDQNMYLFGLTAPEAEAVLAGGYNPVAIHSQDPEIHRILDHFQAGFSDGVSYQEIVNKLLFGDGGQADPYLLLKDFRSYAETHKKMLADYRDQTTWNQMALRNIARSYIFDADRSVSEYADNIWHIPHKWTVK